MKNELKIALTVLGLAITLFLSCTDNHPLEFPSLEEVRQQLSSSGEPLSEAASSSSSFFDNSCDEEDKCNGLCYNKETQFCYNETSVYDKCNGHIYNVKNQICCGNDIKATSLFGCCNEISYLLADHGCKNNEVLTRCGTTSLFNPTEEFCASNSEVYPLCNGKKYDPPEQKCEDGVLKGDCGSKPINFTTHFCYNGVSYALCGGEDYNPRAQFCSSGNRVYDKCDGEDYNPSTDFCYGTTIKPLCGGESYNLESQFCSSNKVYDNCNGNTYDPLIYYCHNDKTFSCNNKPYNPATQFCHSGTTIKDKCGGTEEYDATQFCSGNKVYPLCDGNEYNPLVYYCYNNTLYSCGDKSYNPATQFCYENSTIGNFCGSNLQKSYDPNLYECKTGSNGIYLKGGITDSRDNNKKYDAVLIGTQVWMAENLNYRTPDGKSRCHQGNCTFTNTANCIKQGDVDDADNANCSIYGRLYSWETVNSGNICPSGWHLPSGTEWTTLTNFVGGGTTVGTKLKATSGWNDYSSSIKGNGTDDRGFAGLPGGGYYNNGSFGSIGEVAFWWSSAVCTGYYNGTAYRTDFYTYPSGLSTACDSNSPLLSSVRCVKDN